MYNQLRATPEVEPTQPELHAIRSRLERAIDGGNELMTRMSGVLDRAFGVGPKSDQSPSKPREVASGAIAEIRQQIDDLIDQQNLHAQLMSRIERII